MFTTQDHIDDLMDEIEHYGDLERHMGKAMSRGDDDAIGRWDKATAEHLDLIRELLERPF